MDQRCPQVQRGVCVRANFGYNDSMQEASAIDATCFGSAFTPRLLVNRLSATATATANLLVCRDKSFGDSGWWHHHGRKGCRGGIFRRDDLGANCAKSLSHLVCWLLWWNADCSEKRGLTRLCLGLRVNSSKKRHVL